jgi:hypothetical protein
MADNRSGSVSMLRDGQRYTGSFHIENDVLHVATETGTLSRPLKGLPAKELAQQLLAKLVDQEIRSLR